MRARLQLHCIKLAYLFFGVILFGAVASGLLTTDQRWMNWHFSRLGEGGMLSALVFNASLLVSAFIMFTISIALTDNINHIAKATSTNLNKARTVVQRSLLAVTVCLVGVAVFPFDRFPVIHNIFGYSMLFIFLALCIVAPKMLPIFSHKFYLYGRFAIWVTAICYVFYIIIGSITLLVVEFIIFAFLYGWLLMFINGIVQQALAKE